MTELILTDKREGLDPLPPSTDIDSLRQRFLPREGEELTIDRYEHAGIEIIGTVRDLAQILGELTEIGWHHLRPHIRWQGERIKDTQRTRWAEYCAMLWGCSRPTVSKAWLSATSTIERPQNMSMTTFYEILAGCDTPEEADRVVDLALNNEWRSYHIRLIKRLHDARLLPKEEWILPRVTRRGEQLYVYLHGIGGTHFATIRDDDSLARIGVFMLTDGAGIEREQKTIGGKASDISEGKWQAERLREYLEANDGS